MIIVRHLTAILEDMVNDQNCDLASYQYESKPLGNVRLDNKKPSPTALFIQLTDFQLDINRLTSREKCHVNVCFLEKENKLDSKAISQDEIITRMKDLGTDFLKRVMEDRSLKILDETVDCKSVFYASDSNRTGVCLMFDVEQKQGECL